jgi:hypothetical protein
LGTLLLGLAALLFALLLGRRSVTSVLEEKATEALAYVLNIGLARAPFTEALRNVVTSLAFVFAGSWTYYVFIRGRTFKPRISLHIELTGVCGRGRNIAIFRIKIRNEGRSRVRPLACPAEFYYGTIDKADHLRFEKSLDIENTLTALYDPSEMFFLEPQDEFTVDVPILLNPALEESRQPIMLVRVEFVDARLKAWRERRIVSLEREKGA